MIRILMIVYTVTSRISMRMRFGVSDALTWTLAGLALARKCSPARGPHGTVRTAESPRYKAASS